MPFARDEWNEHYLLYQGFILRLSYWQYNKPRVTYHSSQLAVMKAMVQYNDVPRIVRTINSTAFFASTYHLVLE